MKDVFILSEFVRPEENSTGLIWSRIIERLSKEYECTVICPAPIEGNKDAAWGGVNRRVFSRPTYNKSRFISRLFGQFLLALKFIRELRQCVQKGDVVFSGTNPAVLLILLPFLKRISKFQWVLLVHDVYPENLVPAGLITKKSISFRLLRWFFDFVYASADKVIVIGRDMHELLSEKMDGDEKLRLITNWASLDEISPIARHESSFIKQQDWNEKIILQFFGNIGRVQGIPTLLDAISRVTSTKAVFLFIGDGAHRYKIEEFIAKTRATNVVWMGSVPMDQKNEGLAACDIALITLKKGMAGLGVPSKAYYSMAANKPLLAVMEPHAEIARVVDEHEIGWHCNPGDAGALARLIDEICAADRSDGLIKVSPRSVLTEHYAEPLVLDRFAEVISELHN